VIIEKKSLSFSKVLVIRILINDVITAYLHEMVLVLQYGIRKSLLHVCTRIFSSQLF
jgi:hypothetical protein